jgi:hypothetical protein
MENMDNIDKINNIHNKHELLLLKTNDTRTTFKIIREDIFNRLISIVCLITRYNCNPNEKYKNVVKNLLIKFTYLEMFTLFNDLFNDIYIINCPFVYKIIIFYYQEIKLLILDIINILDNINILDSINSLDICETKL